MRFLSFLSLLILSVFTITTASFAVYENNFFILSEKEGLFPTPFILNIEAKEKESQIFWTLHPNRAFGAGNLSEGYKEKIEINRTTDLGVFTYSMNPILSSSMEIFRFRIESPRENEYFRISKIEPQPKSNFVTTITVENDSEFSMSLDGWKITTDNEEILLPDEEINAQEKRKFIVSLSPNNGEVLLTSPLGIIKDRVSYSDMNSGQYLQRKISNNKKEKRLPFEVFSYE